MKKNLRIVSAAAAALLAVAPVVASNVSVANAGVVPGGNVTETKPSDKVSTNDITFSSPLNTVNYNTKESDLTNDSFVMKNLSVSSPNGSQVVGLKNTMLAEKDAKTGKFVQVHSMTAGQTYYLVTEATINGLSKDTNTEYKLTNSTKGTSKTVKPTNQGTITDIQVAIQFVAVDPNAAGNPYISYNTSVNNTPSWETLSDKQTAFSKDAPATVGEMVDAINGKFQWAPNSSKATVAYTTNVQEVIRQLTAKGIKVNGDTSAATFTIPEGGFNYTVTATNTINGKSVVAYAHFKSSVDNSLNNPLIQYSKDSKTGYFNVQQGSNNFNNAMPIVEVKLGTNDWADTIINHFSATQSGKKNGNNVDPNGGKLRLVSSDLTATNFNPNAAGLYPMTLVAKNSDGLTTTLNFNVAVVGSDKDAIANVTVHSNGQVKLVSMVANTTSDLNGVVVNNGQQITVYPNDTKTVNGVEYTRVARTNVDREQNNQWIETKYIKEEKQTQRTVMHNAKVYNKKGEATNKPNIKTYATVTVYGDKVKLDNGKEAYKIGDDEYVVVGNIDGTKRTLKHNAYVYATSKKRANKVTLKKGETVTTYGSAVKFKNGKLYYRIEGCTASNKMYVKKANF